MAIPSKEEWSDIAAEYRAAELHGVHLFDDDATCVLCGFDGAEWHHLMKLGYPVAPQPNCEGK